MHALCNFKCLGKSERELFPDVSNKRVAAEHVEIVFFIMGQKVMDTMCFFAIDSGTYTL